jgi:hypothetical protein
MRREARISGNGPVSVLSQTGEMQMVVEWVQSAYQDIQNLSDLWEFLRTDFSFNTIASTSTYTPTAAGLTELLNWRTADYDSVKCYLTATGVNDEQYITQISWDDMRGTRMLGSSSTQAGRPTEYAIKPNKSIVFWPVPDAVYTVSGEYYKRAQTMTANTDEPNFPSTFHMILVWLAMRYSGAYQAAPEKYMHADNEYKRLLSGLRRDQLPGLSMGGPLA